MLLFYRGWFCPKERTDLRIHRAYNGYWCWGRPTAEQLRRDLREMSQAIRPDWSPRAEPKAQPHTP